MTQNTIATAIKTVKIEYTDAPIIRCVARQDMPEFGMLEGSCFYLARSSKNDGTYYLLTWDYERIQFHCSCPATKLCRHMKLVNADCARTHTLNAYKPVSKAEKFDTLVARYDVRSQAHQAWLQAEKLRACTFRSATCAICNGDHYTLHHEAATFAAAAASWQAQGFSPRDEAYYNAKFAHAAEDDAVRNRQAARLAAEKAPLHSNAQGPKMEKAPSGNWVPMR